MTEPTRMAVARRDTIVAMTFGVVLLSLLIQGLTMGRALSWLGVSSR